MYLGQQQDHAGSPAMSSTPTDQPQRKPVGRWCLAGSVERPGVVEWQIEVVAVMRRWKPDGRNVSGTVELGRACSWISWISACRRARCGTSSQCSSVCRSRDKPRSNLVVPADHSSCCVQHSLQLVCRYFRCATIAIETLRIRAQLFPRLPCDVA